MSTRTVATGSWKTFIPDLTAEETQNLEQAIIEAGEVLIPIEMDEDGNILDGRARKEIADRLNIPYTTVVRRGLSDEQKRDHIIRLNVARRHLSLETMRELIFLLRRDGQSLQAIADATGVSKSSVHRALASAPGDGADLPDKITGKTGKSYPAHPARPSAGSETDLVTDHDVNVETETPADRYDGTLRLDSVSVSSILDLDIPAESVDLILTDPTGADGSVVPYATLAELGARVLRPGGLCITYVRTADLPHAIASMSAHMEYSWTCGVLQPKTKQGAKQRGFLGRLRLLLVFRKPGETIRTKLVPDGIETLKGPRTHTDGPVRDLAAAYVEAFTRAGDVVLDPCAKTGTILAAARALGRHFVGFDQDETNVRKVISRLSSPDGGSDDDGDDGDDAPDPGGCPSDIVPSSSNLPLERAARVPAGQLEADWDGDKSVIISRGGLPLVRVPVIHERLSDTRFARPAGNRKCENVMGVCNSCSEACFRILSGFDGCERPCFSSEDGIGGCFANCTEVSRQRRSKKRMYDVAHNGVVNGLAKIRLPKDDDFTLPRPEVSDPLHQPLIYRMDGESTDGSLSISLGLMQRFAEANPDYRFLSFCSDYFRPSDENLRWLASLGICWTSHTTGGWFGSDELESRYAAIARYIEFGVPTVVSICTRDDWDNDAVLRRILELVPEDRVIEAPFRTGNHHQGRPLFGINPRGACGDQRYDGKGRLVQTIEENGESRFVVPLPDGTLEKPYGSVHARCRNCKVLCGYWAVFGESDPLASNQTASVPRVVVASMSGATSNSAPAPESVVEPALSTDPLPGAGIAPEPSVPAEGTRQPSITIPTSGDVAVVVGDCLGILPQLPDGCIDLVVTSPPYNVGAEYASYDDALDRGGYLDWIVRVAAELRRVLSDDGSLFLNIGSVPSDPWIAHDVAERLRGDWVLQNDIDWVWSIHDGERTIGQFKPVKSQRYLHRTWEHLFQFTKHGKVPLDRLAIGVPYESKGNIDRFGSPSDVHCRGNTWFVPHETIRDRQSERGGHPAVFPVALPRMCMRLHGVERIRCVLDPFTGSGTTLVAAAELGVSALGIELDQGYADFAGQRVAGVASSTATDAAVAGRTTVSSPQGGSSQDQRSSGTALTDGADGPVATTNDTVAASLEIASPPRDENASLRSIKRPAPRQHISDPSHVTAANVEWVDTRTVPTETTPTFADLFAGCGGMSHGFSMACFRPLLGIDADPHALETYGGNTPDAKALLARIEDLTDDAILAAVNGQKVDLLVGGPPCQGYSTAGERRSDDPRNQLWRQFVRAAGVLRPSHLVIENVPGILSFEDGRVIEELLSSLTEVGYPGASVLTLNAANYGVPQTRERVFILANRHGLPNPYPMPLLESSEYVTVWDAIGDLRDLTRNEVLNHVWPDHEPATLQRLGTLAEGESLHETYTESWRRLILDRPAPTVKHNSGGSAVHPVLPRTLSVREMARLQGFPDRFIFRGTMQSMLRQVGNAVPPPLAQHVALALRASLAAVSDPAPTDIPHRVTYQVTAEPLRQLLDVLLAWRKRTGHHLGISELIATILSGTNLKGPEAPTNPDVDLVPLNCYLPTRTLEAISEMAEHMGPTVGAVPGSSLVVDEAIRHFAVSGRYERTHLLWESHRDPWRTVWLPGERPLIAAGPTAGSGGACA